MSGDEKDPKFEPGDDATFQMDPAEVAKLHAMLGTKPAPDRPIQRTLNYMDASKLKADLEAANPNRHLGDASAVKAPVAAKAASPPVADAPRQPAATARSVKPTPAAAAPSVAPRQPQLNQAAPRTAATTAKTRAPLVGIGALMAVGSIVCLMLPMFQGNRDMFEIAYTVGPGLMAIGYLLMAIGIPSLRPATSGLASVAAGFAFLTACVGAVALVVILGRLGGFGGSALALMSLALAPGLCWFFMGLWGLSGGRAAGVLGSVWGITGLIGGAALLAGNLLFMLEVVRPDADMVIALTMAGTALVVISAVSLAIACFGALKTARV